MKRTSHGACSAFRGRLYLLTRAHTHTPRCGRQTSFCTALGRSLENVWTFSEITIVSFFLTRHFVFSPHTNCPWLNKPAPKTFTRIHCKFCTKAPSCFRFFKHPPPPPLFRRGVLAVNSSEVAAYWRSAAGGGKVHILVLPAEQVGLICCYGNSCYKERFVPEGQAHFLWH